MYAEMHHVIKIEIVEQHILRKATKDAGQSVKQIASSGMFVEESEDARAKRTRELVETAVAMVISQDVGVSRTRANHQQKIIRLLVFFFVSSTSLFLGRTTAAS